MATEHNAPAQLIVTSVYRTIIIAVGMSTFLFDCDYFVTDEYRLKKALSSQPTGSNVALSVYIFTGSLPYLALSDARRMASAYTYRSFIETDITSARVSLDTFINKYFPIVATRVGFSSFLIPIEERTHKYFLVLTL